MKVAVDPAELGAGFDHSGGTPAQGHLSIPPAFDVAGVVPPNFTHAFPFQSTGTRVAPRSYPVPLQSPSQARAIFMPGTARAVNRFPSDSSQDSIKAPVLMPPGLTTRRRWFTFIRLLDSYLPPPTTAFSRTFTTMAYSPQQLVAV
jgi:hypothetical protein